MARDAERRRRIFRDRSTDRLQKLVPAAPPKPPITPPKTPENIQTPQPHKYTGLPKKQTAQFHGNAYERNHTVDKPIKNLSASAPRHTQTQKILCDVNDVVEAISRKTTPRRDRNKLIAAQDLVATIKKSREELKITHNQITQVSSDNSSSGHSEQSSDSKCVLTPTRTLTPKQVARIDAVKRNRRINQVNQVTNVQTEKGVNVQSVEMSYAWPEHFDKPRIRKVKVDNILTRKSNNSRFEKEVINLRPHTRPSQTRPPSPLIDRLATLSPSPLRERLAMAKSNGKLRRPRFSSLALTRSASELNLPTTTPTPTQTPKLIQKENSDRNLRTLRNLNISASVDTRDDPIKRHRLNGNLHVGKNNKVGRKKN